MMTIDTHNFRYFSEVEFETSKLVSKRFEGETMLYFSDGEIMICEWQRNHGKYYYYQVKHGYETFIGESDFSIFQYNKLGEYTFQI